MPTPTNWKFLALGVILVMLALAVGYSGHTGGARDFAVNPGEYVFFSDFGKGSIFRVDPDDPLLASVVVVRGLAHPRTEYAALMGNSISLAIQPSRFWQGSRLYYNRSSLS